MVVNGKGPNSGAFLEYSWDSWIPQTLEQPWGRPTTSKDGFTTSILLAMGQETHKWGKHTCWGRANTHLVLSTILTNKPSWSQRFRRPAKGNVYVRGTALVQNKSEPRRGNENLLHLYAPLQVVLVPLLQSVLGLAATPTRVKVFIPSVHLNSNIQNISFSRLAYYSKEKWKNWGKTHSLPLLAIILHIMSLNSVRNTTLQMKGLGIP